MRGTGQSYICWRRRGRWRLLPDAAMCCLRISRRRRSSCCRTVCASRPSSRAKSPSSRRITRARTTASRTRIILLSMSRTMMMIVSCPRRLSIMALTIMMLLNLKMTTAEMRMSSRRNRITAIWPLKSKLPILIKHSACRSCCWIWVRTAMCAVAAASAV